MYMSLFQLKNALLLAWYAAIFSIYIFALWMAIGHAQAVSLSISGHCVGSGILSMNYTGDALNVSLIQNGTAWLINATTGVA
jgi:NO-binding membrane sensor protein with MHYT domain